MNKLFLTLIASFFLFSVNAQELTQTVRGRVIDKDSEFPLSWATVQIATTDPAQATICDTNGYFFLEKVPVGRHTLIISYVGYKDYMLPELLVGSAKEVVLEVGLQERVEQIDEASVTFKRSKDQALNEMALVSSRQFTVEEASRYAASLDDPARMATAFAGVAMTGDDINNEIVIRGNSPRGMLWRVEGVAVPNPNHFAEEGSSGGAVSIISNNVLDNSDFLTGAWPAEYSNALSGVFDINMRNGNNRKREYALQVGLLGVDFAAEGPFSKKSNASYLINYRYSSLALFDAAGIHIMDEREGIPKFQDLTYKINMPTKRFGTFSLWGFGGISHLTTDPIIQHGRTHQGIEYNYLEYGGYEGRTSVGATGLKHKYFFNSKSFVETNLLFSGTTYLNEELGRLEPNVAISKIDVDQHQEIDKTQLLGSIHYQRKFNSQFTFRTGASIRELKFDAFVEEYDYDSLQLFTTFSKDGSLTFMDAFAEGTYKFTDQLSLYAGINYNHLLYNNTYSLEPRAALSWKFSSGQSLTLGYGQHSQLQAWPLYLVDVETDGELQQSNKDLGFNKADHYVLSYNNSLARNFRIKLDLYYQHLYNIPIPIDTSGSTYLKTYSALNDVSWFTFVPLENEGTGRNYGIELTMEKFLSRGWYALMTASLYESKYTAKDDLERNTRFNGNYIFNVLGGKEYKIKQNLLGVNVKYMLSGGPRYTPVVGELTLTDSNGNPAIDPVSGQPIRYAPVDWENAFSKKAADYSRLDLSLFYRINRPKVAHILTFEVQNVLNRENIGGVDGYNLRTHEYNYWYQSGLIPVFKYRIEF